MNKSVWGKIINIVITVLTAIATTFGITSCMGVYIRKRLHLRVQPLFFVSSIPLIIVKHPTTCLLFQTKNLYLQCTNKLIHS